MNLSGLPRLAAFSVAFLFVVGSGVGAGRLDAALDAMRADLGMFGRAVREIRFWEWSSRRLR